MHEDIIVAIQTGKYIATVESVMLLKCEGEITMATRECECNSYDCCGPHGISDWCEHEAVGTWKLSNGKAELCGGCALAAHRGQPVAANEWFPFARKAN
jgi:hypothetical protein